MSRYLLDAVFQSEKLGTNLRIAGDSQMTVPVSRCHIVGIYGRRPVILGAVESNALVSGEHGIFGQPRLYPQWVERSGATMPEWV